MRRSERWIGIALGALLAVGIGSGPGAIPLRSAGPQEPDPPRTIEEKPAAERDWEPIPLELPKPAFKGTPKHVPPGANLEKPRKGPRPAFLAPPGTTNVARGASVSSSDEEPIIGSLKLLTDGDKEALEGSYVELGPGLQHVQVDLGKSCEIRAVVLWHYHMNARVYHDVVIQVSDDPDFILDVRTVFNNDHDNSSGLGLGEDLEYWETYEGKLVDAGGARGRYVRCSSAGSTSDDMNHYTELEVYGRPAP